MHEKLKSEKIGMTVEKFVTTKTKNGRRGSPRLAAGATLYAIKYVGKVGYFTYSYQNEQDAKDAIQRMIDHDTDNAFYYPWNVVESAQNTLHVTRK